MEKKKEKKSKIKLVIFIILLYTLLPLISLILAQPILFFHPWHDEKSYNQLLNEENFEEIRINNNGKLLNGWIKYNTDQQQAPLLIFFGGNAQNSSNTCLYFLHTDKYKYFDGYNLMIIDYPGYGLSDGKPSDKTMFDSALKVYDYASQLDCVDEDNIVVLGYSIGTGVATYVASQRDINGLILVAPYDELLSVYNDKLNIFHGPLKALAFYKFPSLEYAPNVNTNPIIFTSHADEVINYKFSISLSEYFKNLHSIHIFENTKHAEYFSNSDFYEQVKDYLQSKLK